jgi:hypothetical protein
MATGHTFRRIDLGRLEKDATVVVTLSTPANVRLMNSTNLSNFKNRRRHQYYGGLAKVSPLRIRVPSSGTWHLTIDRIGMKSATVRSSVQVEPPPLPVARSSRPLALAGIRHEAAPNLVPDADGEIWDVFISHASEDKESVALPLAEALTARGIKVWIDSGELRIGDSLRRRIDQGLASSTFGVVVCSKHFFAKGWPQYELDGIVGLSVAGKQRLLPIWHEITLDEIQRQSPSLADKIARNTATATIEQIAEEIAEVVRASAEDAA